MDKRNNRYKIEDANHVGEVIISWIITHACQEHCGYCISPCKRSEITSEADHFAIQEKLIQGGLTKNRYIGGEPLLIPHIHKLIQDAYERGLDTRLSTNGILLTESRFNEMKNFLNSVAFPFESVDDELNARIRGFSSKGHRQIVEERIKMVKAAGNIGVLVNTCVHKENIKSLEDLGYLLNTLEIDHWKLRRFNSASGRGAVPNRDKFEITDEEFFDAVIKLQKMYPYLKIDGRMPSKLETRLMVSPQGDLYRMVGAETIFYGNMLHDDIIIKDIYMRDHCN
jgi:MoaA/NifB/PqqE/SkfB family radical SAM enzyme